MGRAVQVGWSVDRTPSRELVLQAYADALETLAGAAASTPVLVEREPMEGGDRLLFATSLERERWSLRAGGAEVLVSITPILASVGVTGEELYGEGSLSLRACLSRRRPGFAALSGGPREGDDVASAFVARFGSLATPSEDEQRALALEALRYLARYGYLTGFAPAELLAGLAGLPATDPRGALGRLWLGWQALAEGDASTALGRLQPLVALGDALAVAVQADLALAPVADETGFRLQLSGAPQKPLALARIGVGLALELQGRREEAVAALTSGLAWCEESSPDASRAAVLARQALGRLR